VPQPGHLGLFCAWVIIRLLWVCLKFYLYIFLCADEAVTVSAHRSALDVRGFCALLSDCAVQAGVVGLSIQLATTARFYAASLRCMNTMF
jgi:hypothetical protein